MLELSTCAMELKGTAELTKRLAALLLVLLVLLLLSAGVLVSAAVVLASVCLVLLASTAVNEGEGEGSADDVRADELSALLAPTSELAR